MGVLPWSPLAGGWLTGGYRKDKELPESRRRTRLPARYDMSTPDNQRKLDAADALAATGRRGRAVADPPRARIRDAASGSHRADHRTAHARPPEVSDSGRPTSRCRWTSSTRSTRSCRQDRPISRSDQGYQPPSLTDPFLRRRRIE